MGRLCGIACCRFYFCKNNLRAYLRLEENSETLWSDVISKYPTVEVAYKNRGNYYGQNGKHDLALKDYDVYLKMN